MPTPDADTVDPTIPSTTPPGPTAEPAPADPTEHGAPVDDAPRDAAEAAYRAGNAIDPDRIILVPPFDPGPPMRHPDGAWAMLITEIDTTAEGTETTAPNPYAGVPVAFFTGMWIRQQPAIASFTGDLVLRFAPPSRTGTPRWQAAHVDIEMLLAANDRWQRVGLWLSADAQWPYLVVPTARAVMALSVAAVEGTGISLEGEQHNGWHQCHLEDGRSLADVRAASYAEQAR
jgi:hypothetical protein